MATTTSTLRLKVGGKYKTRDGRVAEVDEVRTAGTYCIDGTVDGCGRCWTIDGVWYVGDESGLDLVSEIQDEAPVYRYFRWACDDVTDRYFVIWRSAPGSDVVEGICPNREGDEWIVTGLKFGHDLLEDPDIVECDADGNLLQTPDPAPTFSFKTTEDITPEQRTRIAKLAARIVLADGPVFTVGELAGLTVGELVCKLEGVTTRNAIEL